MTSRLECNITNIAWILVKSIVTWGKGFGPGQNVLPYSWFWVPIFGMFSSNCDIDSPQCIWHGFSSYDSPCSIQGLTFSWNGQQRLWHFLSKPKIFSQTVILLFKVKTFNFWVCMNSFYRILTCIFKDEFLVTKCINNASPVVMFILTVFFF